MCRNLLTGSYIRNGVKELLIYTVKISHKVEIIPLSYFRLCFIFELLKSHKKDFQKVTIEVREPGML